ncbi:Dolichyl-phosphate-mannose-protein mannosyltransferase [Clostridium cavendishii DSM 21758]|uniref:Dolichyl-phosphate-mannose-protein mannosyltransferase n=1 Tax=Clostridium cavendishii DSM 21758 TaxID=1121302 RepID=A0A1M6HY50_9CLOT|nr:glycosyltransferase family 39 protein [Clostridium cavendishii]SHJ27101.1 Dolichyl-phosphate-mannose-protein mannosyltransferase [Clostridium cavendishii DSM 21758]
MKNIKFTKENIMLTLILILSTILNFSNLGIEGYANLYYAAGVKSMTLSLKNFFFVSFDPTSFVTIDKPPLGFWLQAISAKIFGYNGWSIILPQAVAGVVSVGLIYVLVKRTFGSKAGLISALCLAVTPVFVAVSRNNTCDNLLVVTLLVACLFISKAAEKGNLKHLLISLAIVGIGFNIKMLQAYMILPALYLTYLLSNAVSIKKRIIHLIAGTVVLLLVSFSWACIVDLVPVKDRPYVGSSTNNSELELIIGHNGLERLGIGVTSTKGGGAPQGQNGMMPGGPNGSSEQNTKDMQGQNGNNNQGMPPMSGKDGNMPSDPPSGMQAPNMSQDGKGMQKPNGGGQGGTFGGQEQSGITRLFSNNSLSDQIIWLFPLAVFGFIAAALKEKLNKKIDNERKLSLILWSMWLLPEFIYFSFTKGLFHPYYLTMMAAPISALVGIGVIAMWNLYNEGGWKSWLLPQALMINTLIQMLILSYNYNTSKIVKILIVTVLILSGLSSILFVLVNVIKRDNIGFKKLVISIAMIGLLVTPLVYSATTIFYKMSGTFPAAGLSLISNKEQGIGNMGEANGSNDKLIKFLKSHKTTEKYLLVTSTTNGYASDIIIKTDESVMTWGFFGTDKAITLDEFKKLVDNGEIRYVMVGGNGGGANNEIMNWAKENGKLVSESEWKDSNDINNNISNKDDNKNKENLDDNTKQQFGNKQDMSEQLYDLKDYTDKATKK